MPHVATMRIGIDLGGTKTEIVALDAAGAIRLRRRVPTPPAHPASVALVAGLVAAAERELGETATVGVGIPGSLSPTTGRLRGANSTWLNGTTLDRDLEAALGRRVQLANDADCLALSEAADGAGAGAATVFAAILGTGVGGGVVVHGRLLVGRNRIAGEWGHNPLPWMTPDEHPGPACWCGRRGCIEAFLSGPALAADGHAGRDATALPARAAAGDALAAIALDRHAHRLARALASVINLLDPDCIVLGGGLSNLARLYDRVPALWAPFVFSDAVTTPLRQAKHGDSSGVLGAARLWDVPRSLVLT